MKNLEIWIVGNIILTMFFVFAGSISYVPSYVYERIGLNRDILLLLLWIIPIYVSYYVTINTKNYNILFGLSFILMLPLLGGLTHYINTKYMGGVDFTGISGAVVIMKLYGFIGIFTSSLGTFIGNSKVHLQDSGTKNKRRKFTCQTKKNNRKYK